LGDTRHQPVGAFALGLFLTLGLGQLSVAVMTPIAVGVIGGFTTFSTFMWEGFTFSRTGRAGVALVYISVSVVGGLIAAWGGCARPVHSRLTVAPK
jgi:CrcB protein